MGKDFPRIRRLYVGDARAADTPLSGEKETEGAILDQFLAAEHRGVRTAVASTDVQQSLFSEYQDDGSTWYLVDPGGWIMMSYNSDIPYKDVISDLKFLLKNSSE